MARTKNTQRKSTGRFSAKNQFAAAARKTVPRQPTVRVKRRLGNGVKALNEIRKYQKSVKLLIRLAPFYRLVRELASDIKLDLKFQRTALQAPQYSAEGYIVSIFEKAFQCSVHRKRATVNHKDIRLVMLLERGEYCTYDSSGAHSSKQLEDHEVEAIQKRKAEAKKKRKNKANRELTQSRRAEATQRYNIFNGQSRQ